VEGVAGDQDLLVGGDHERTRARAARRDLHLLPPSAVIGAVVVNLLPAGDGVRIGLLEEGLIRFVLINVLLAVFNMIPIPPLDGGNVLIGVLPQQMAAGVEQLRSWGFVLLYVLMLSGFLSAITYPVQRAILNWLL